MNLKCGGCGAELVVEEHLRTAQCPYCASPQVIERAASDHPPPRFALGFQVPREEAEAKLRHWLRRRSWYAPSGLKRATLQELKGVYVPAYLFSAVARSFYRRRSARTTRSPPAPGRTAAPRPAPSGNRSTAGSTAT